MPSSDGFLSLALPTLTRSNNKLHQAASRAITGYLSFSFIFLLLFEMSLPPLRTIPTPFTPSSYEQAFRLPSSFLISCLARLGVKPRLFLSLWRTFGSTHPLVPASTSPTEVLLACPSSLLWNPLSFTVELTLSSPCSRFDPPLSRQGAALAYFDSFPTHNQVISASDFQPFAGAEPQGNISLARGTPVQ